MQYSNRNSHHVFHVLIVTAIIFVTIGLVVWQPATSAPRFAAITQWVASQSQLPQPHAAGTVVVAGSNVVAIGGYNSSEQPINTVLRARILEDGQLGPWEPQANRPPVPVFFTSAAATDSHIYLVGGWDGGKTRNEVWSATIDANGNVGGWTEIAPKYPNALDLHQVEIANNRLYVLGGWTGTAPLSTVRVADIDPQTGALGEWRSVSALPRPLYRFASAVFQDRFIFVAGGLDANQTTRSEVYYAPIDPTNGSLGPWTQLPSLQNARTYHDIVIHDGQLLALGGYTGSVFLSNVEAATISASGITISLSGWNNIAQLPQALVRFGAVAISRRGSNITYVVGGQTTTSASSIVNTVYHTDLPPEPPTPTPTAMPTATPLPDLILELDHSPTGPLQPGDEVLYTIRYRNNGIANLTNVVISNTIPSLDSQGVMETSNISGNGQRNAGPPPYIQWSLGNLGINESGSVSYRARWPYNEPKVSTGKGLQIIKHGPPIAQAGVPFEYVLTITSTQEITEALHITDMIQVNKASFVPDGEENGTRFFSGAITGTLTLGDSTVNWILPNGLSSGQSVTVSFTIVVEEPGLYLNDKYGVRSLGSSSYSVHAQHSVTTLVVDKLPFPVRNTGASASFSYPGGRGTSNSNGVLNPPLEMWMPIIHRNQ